MLCPFTFFSKTMRFAGVGSSDTLQIQRARIFVLKSLLGNIRTSCIISTQKGTRKYIYVIKFIK